MATTTDDAALKPDPAILAKVKPAPFERRPLVENQRDYAWITDKICRIVEEKTPAWWWVCFAVAALTASFTVMGLVYLVSTGVGVWGLANPVNWGWAIVNFVFDWYWTCRNTDFSYPLFA